MQSEPSPHFQERHARTSSLARLQQVLVFGAVALALAWVGWAWPHSKAAVGVAVLLLTLGHAVILGLEAVAAALINRADTVPRASFIQWTGAWWQEVKVAPMVFAWRQPFRWKQLPDTATAPTAGLPAVVLVHGFFCNRGFWLPWMEQLRTQGVPYISVNLQPIFGSIDDYAPIVDDAVKRATALTGKKPTVICHSMGGLAARAWLVSTPDAASRVNNVITIGTPHNGTWLARFSHLANGRQMRHHCAWQQNLVARELDRHPQRNAGLFVCWYSNTDNIVFPASTATLPGADNRLVPGAAHVALAFHPRVMAESLAMVVSAGNSPSARTAS